MSPGPAFGIFLPAAYLVGAIPCGLLLARRFAGLDIRAAGSGNIGATNVRRLAGTRLGAAALVCDILKGWLPLWLVCRLLCRQDLTPAVEWGLALTGLAAFFGHLYPVFLGFRGGKGVATAAGVVGYLVPEALGMALAGFLLTVLLTRRVSAGSLMAAILMPLTTWWRDPFYSYALILMTGVIALFIFLRHRDNIARLLAGTEPRI
ncbi:MAG: acyl-phosphate glycerol 3-phosphate acyltransferase [Desulfobacterales bacterium]|nr:MAG: acyl-phosphate glycerol 3-phosphate acyltransferase [Desulfobacterales bacterium]